MTTTSTKTVTIGIRRFVEGKVAGQDTLHTVESGDDVLRIVASNSGAFGYSCRVMMSEADQAALDVEVCPEFASRTSVLANFSGRAESFWLARSV